MKIHVFVLHGLALGISSAAADWAGHLTAERPQTVPCFTNRASAWPTNLLWTLPQTNWGIYYQHEAVILSNKLATPIEVYNFRSVPVTNGPSPLVISNLPVGHYWVQCNAPTRTGWGDRTQFTVLPADYDYYEYVGAQLFYSPDLSKFAGTTLENRPLRIKPSLAKGGQSGWKPVAYAGTNDWSLPDQVISTYRTPGGLLYGAKTRLMWQIVEAPDWVIPTDPFGRKTPTSLYSTNWDAFRTVYTNFCAEFANRYGTNFIIELFNECYSGALWEYPTNSWKSKTWEQQLAQTVGAAVDAIRQVSVAKYGSPTNILVWGPSAQSSFDIHLSYFTNSQYKPYYDKLDGITWHEGGILNGPADEIFIHPECWESWQTQTTYYARSAALRQAFPGKTLVIDESYPPSPDALGRTNAIYYNPHNVDQRNGRYIESGIAWSNYPNAFHTNTWKDIWNRYIKQNVAFKQAGVATVKPENFDTCCCSSRPSADAADTNSWVDWVAWYGWTEHAPGWGGRSAGPNPTHDAFMMTAYWLNGFSPKTNFWRDVVFRAVFTNSVGAQRDVYWSKETTTGFYYLQTAASRVMDVYGAPVDRNNVTEEPVFVDVVVPESAPRSRTSSAR